MLNHKGVSPPPLFTPHGRLKFSTENPCAVRGPLGCPVESLSIVSLLTSALNSCVRNLLFDVGIALTSQHLLQLTLFTFPLLIRRRYTCERADTEGSVSLCAFRSLWRHR